MSVDSLKIGLALGSGSSRGWAHIGIIKALAELGIEPDIVCGCSIGAIVGASYVTGNLQQLEHWVTTLSKRDVARFFELNLSFNGFVDPERMHQFMTEYVCSDGQHIEELPKVYASVATELKTGREIWFTEGLVTNAVLASMSLPGLFPPLQHQGRWLVDGGLVNPVPVSVCRALGAEFVIAVNLNGDIVGKHFTRPHKETAKEEESMLDVLTRTLKDHSGYWFTNLFNNGHPPEKGQEPPPSLFDAIAGSVNITQDRITRSRMAGDPPDLLLTPKLSHIGLLEFFRAKDAIQEGRDCVQRLTPEILHTFGLVGP